MQGKWKNGKPKYLNWKCIDNFDKVSDDKIYYDCKDIKLSEKQRRDAKREFDILRVKYTKIIKDFLEECNGEKKTHLTVAGGNYTFFFTLPHVVKWVRERHPFLGVHIKLSERDDLSARGADILLTAHNQSDLLDVQKILNAGYVYNRKTIEDSGFFAASQESVAVFGNEKTVLKQQDVVLGRFYHTNELKNEIVEHHALTLPDRKGMKPRVIVDQYFLEYTMMRHSVGFGYLFTSMALKDDVVVLDKHYPETFNRFIVHKKNLSKKYNRLGRRLINALQHKESK